jgi:hypothetical protein
MNGRRHLKLCNKATKGKDKNPPAKRSPPIRVPSAFARPHAVVVMPVIVALSFSAAIPIMYDCMTGHEIFTTIVRAIKSVAARMKIGLRGIKPRNNAEIARKTTAIESVPRLRTSQGIIKMVGIEPISDRAIQKPAVCSGIPYWR